MALKKEVIIDLIQVLEDGQIQVRRATRIYEDDKMLSQSYHRHVVEPGTDYSDQDPEVIAVCQAIHTADKIKKFKDKEAANLAKLGETEPIE